MDDRRFDAWTRTFADSISRRGLLGRIGISGTAVLAGIVGRSRSALAHHCSSEGCGCSTGTQHACGHGLVCCASSPGTPGGAGVCTPRGQCGGGCIGRGNACAAHCNWGDGCAECCTGYCGNRGACDTPPNLNATCTSGTQSPCLYGLACCPYVPGLVGGAGTCEYTC